MTSRFAKRSIILGTLISLASIGAGCAQLSNVVSPRNSSSSASDTQAAPLASQALSSVDNGSEMQPLPTASSESTSTSGWLLKPGLFGIDQGIWLGWISLIFGVFGTGSAILGWLHSARFNSKLSRELNSQLNKEINSQPNKEINSRLSCYGDDISNIRDAIEQLRRQAEDKSAQLTRLQIVYQQLEDRYASILLSLNSQGLQQKPEPQSLSFPVLSSSFRPSFESQPCVPTPAQKQAELTAAVNRGDRQVIKAEIQAQLNITNASENAISMGRLNETQLEEVAAGGSYWSASIAGETWLYPTEQTLKGYSQSQRPTGIFNYIRQPISSAQVVSPARLALSGSFWQVVESGSIAVPG